MNDYESQPAFPARSPGQTQPEITIPTPFEANRAARPAPPLPRAEVWMFLELLRRRWGWLAAATLLAGAAGCALGLVFWKPNYIASARIIRNDSPATAQVLNYQTISAQTFSSLLRAPELLRRVGGKATPTVSADALAKRLRLSPEHDGDVVLVEAAAPGKAAAVELANLYCREAIAFTRELQAGAAGEVMSFLKPQLAQIEADMNDVKASPPATAMPATNTAPGTGTSRALLPSAPSTAAFKLQTAREDLVEASTRYTELHPAVIAAKARVAALETMVAREKTAPALSTPSDMAERLIAQRDAQDQLRSQLAPLEATRRELAQRLRAAESVAEQPPGYYRELTPAAERDVKSGKRGVKVAAGTVLCASMGFMGALLLVFVVEFFDRRVKAPADVTRVTGLPLIATAPDLSDKSAAARDDWSFRTWMTLQGRLSPALNHGLVCGLTSAAHGEGRSTWIKHLARAASDSGFRVLIVTAEKNGNSAGQNGHAKETASGSTPENGAGGANGNGNGKGKVNGREHAPADDASNAPRNGGENGSSVATHAGNGRGNGSALPEVLPSMMEVENKLVGPESQSVVNIPLPGWVWNLERRRQWQSTLKEWQSIANVVILIELPPASHPETVLLAQELPNLIWLADSGRSEAAETRAQLETLRHAQCPLVGAVLNRAPQEHLRNRFARWFAPA